MPVNETIQLKIIVIFAKWVDQGLSYLKWSGSQLPEMIRVSATWNDQGLSYLKWWVSQLPEMIRRVSATWNDQCLSYLKWSGSQLPGMIRDSATWSDHCDQSLSCLEWLVSLLSTQRREKITIEDEKIHHPVVFQLRRVVSFVLQSKLSKSSIISDIVSTVVFLNSRK